MIPQARSFVTRRTAATGLTGTGLTATGLAVVGAVALAGSALAQIAPPSPTTMGAASRQVAPLPQKPAAPPALPGAQSSAPAPSQRVPLDMPPNEALFDGVNRGDIETVRDALSRGADLNAQNILGITATEMAIDLGHNDIAFLLLSIRASERSRTARSQRQEPAVPVAATPTARPAPAPRTAPARPAPQPAPQGWAADPGRPDPAAGFLGFGERTATR